MKSSAPAPKPKRLRKVPMSYTLYGVAMTNPENGETAILAAAFDEGAIRSEVYPQFQQDLALALSSPNLTGEDRDNLIASLASVKVVKLSAEIVE